GSGVGVAAIQIAKMMGAGLVLGTAGADDKLEQAKALGMDAGANYKAGDWAPAIQAAAAGRGIDVILDVIGADYWDQNLRVLAAKGRMVIVGLMGGSSTPANLGALLAKRAQVRGTTLRARPLEEKASATRAFEKSVLPHIASGRIKVVVDKAF